MAGGNRVVLLMDSRPENIALARLLVAGMAAQQPFTMAQVEEMKVAVSEAVTNAVIHAYGARVGTVRVEVAADDGVLEITVTDQGCGIADVARARQGAYSSDPERMGLGFAFMESFMDGLEVESVPGQGTRVRMWKRAQEPDRAREPDTVPAAGS